MQLNVYFGNISSVHGFIWWCLNVYFGNISSVHGFKRVLWEYMLSPWFYMVVSSPSAPAAIQCPAFCTSGQHSRSGPFGQWLCSILWALEELVYHLSLMREASSVCSLFPSTLFSSLLFLFINYGLSVAHLGGIVSLSLRGDADSHLFLPLHGLCGGPTKPVVDTNKTGVISCELPPPNLLHSIWQQHPLSPLIFQPWSNWTPQPSTHTHHF